jgi:glycosyltransferase involved in cell wall biosynthesis
MKAVVVIPTYNERENIAMLVERIFRLPGPPVDLFFVDDASPDGTGRLLDDFSAREPRLKVMHRSGKLGLGTAYREAYRILLKEPYDRFIAMDADLSHSPEAIPMLLDASNDAALVIGSRYCPGGGSQNWSLVRRVLSFGANRLCRALLGLKIEDSTAGFRCYRRDLLEVLDQLNVRSNGYAFQIEMAYYSQWLGFQLREVPIIFEERLRAKSKMCRSEITSAIVTMTRLSIHRVLGGRAEHRQAPASLSSTF